MSLIESTSSLPQSNSVSSDSPRDDLQELLDLNDNNYKRFKGLMKLSEKQIAVLHLITTQSSEIHLADARLVTNNTFIRLRRQDQAATKRARGLHARGLDPFGWIIIVLCIVALWYLAVRSRKDSEGSHGL